MNELKFIMDNINPVTVWGSNNEYFEITKKHFPKIKIVARGNEVKVLGDEAELMLFREKFQGIIDHVDKFQSLNTTDLEQLLDTKIHYNVEASSYLLEKGLIGSSSDPIVLARMGLL